MAHRNMKRENENNNRKRNIQYVISCVAAVAIEAVVSSIWQYQYNVI
jgi:hypothetical protein